MLGKWAGAREFIISYDFSAKDLADKIEFLNQELPDNKIVIAGLSAGGALTLKTMEKISRRTQESVFAIVAGVPFWHQGFQSEDILILNNNGEDSLAEGRVGSLLYSLFKAPLEWAYSLVRGEYISFSQALSFPSHQYSWSSPELSYQVSGFLEDRFNSL